MSRSMLCSNLQQFQPYHVHHRSWWWQLKCGHCRLCQCILNCLVSSRRAKRGFKSCLMIQISCFFVICFWTSQWWTIRSHNSLNFLLVFNCKISSNGTSYMYFVYFRSDVIFLSKEVWQTIFASPFSLPACCLTRVVPLLIQFNKRNYMATCGWITLSLESYNLWFNLEPVFHLSELPRDTLDDSVNSKCFSSWEFLFVVGRRFFIVMWTESDISEARNENLICVFEDLTEPLLSFPQKQRCADSECSFPTNKRPVCVNVSVCVTQIWLLLLVPFSPHRQPLTLHCLVFFLFF